MHTRVRSDCLIGIESLQETSIFLKQYAQKNLLQMQNKDKKNNNYMKKSFFLYISVVSFFMAKLNIFKLFSTPFQSKMAYIL